MSLGVLLRQPGRAISGACPDRQAISSRHRDANRAIRAVECLVQWRVGDRVLIPDLPRNLEGDRANLVDARRVVGHPTGPFRELIQLVAALLHTIFCAEQTHGEDDRVALLRLLLNPIARDDARVVDAVGYHQEYFRIAPPLLAK